MKKSIYSNWVLPIWRNVPLSIKHKELIKYSLYKNLPILFGFSQSYKIWAATNLRNKPASYLISNYFLSKEAEKSFEKYVPLHHAVALKSVPVRLIAFYLPQFHAINENDLWWGDGFTEWTNVQPATAKFEGHYQPHIPGELGYYNLLDSKIQHRQIELAKIHGVGGFCFYTYWFGGKLLLEKPIENYLNDASLDFPFCLCWANENWSRRWDGLDSEILIAQKHSPEDDVAFIQHVAQYMRDERYIRIDGKPLLIVYRPNLLPSAKITAKRWRDWCKDNDIGEIYLAYTQSFEAVDPVIYGFDAAIEFPPNNSAPPNITNQVKPTNQSFRGTVYDWEIFVDRSRNYQSPSYKLFRSVCPSWDNTARRKNNGIVFLNSSPRGYQEWLLNAITETRARVSGLDEQIVFVNAWNEWAEGAHLEPDERYGNAYLEATRLAMLRGSLLDIGTNENNNLVAIVIHAFYEDVFLEVLECLKTTENVSFKLYVTTTLEKEEKIRAILNKYSYDFLLRVVENRGRDILPFLKIIKDVIEFGHQFFVKVHTKKSLHRSDGHLWRDDLFSKLLKNESLAYSIDYLKKNHDIGILCPEGHLVDMSYFVGSNAKRIAERSLRMGVDLNDLSHISFSAGSMFSARVSAVIPLINVVSESDFEDEQGQVDGTFAHVIERLFSVSAYSINLSTKSLSNHRLKDYKYV